MKKYLTPVLLSATLALGACGKKDEQKTSSSQATDQTVSVKPVQPGQLPAPVIAAIDVQKILDSSTAAIGIREEIEKKRAEIQKEMTQYETELREKEQKLAKESSTLSPEQLQKKREEFEVRIADVQMKLNVRKLQLETAFEQARSKVYDGFLKASDIVRNEAGANIVFYKEQVVVADTGFDITDQVLNKLNAELPKVEVIYQDENEILKQLKVQS